MPKPKMTNMIKIHRLNFIVGKFNDITNWLIHQIPQKPLTILPCDLHNLALSENKDFRKFYATIDVCTADGMPINIWFKFKNRIPSQRIYGPDLMQKILNHTQSPNYQHIFIYSNKKILPQMNLILMKKYPHLNIQSSLVFSTIADLKKNFQMRKKVCTKHTIIWIGVGSPTQVMIAKALRNICPSSTLYCVGAAFNFMTQTVPQAPVILQNSGLEWLFRLFQEPRRLWKRYLFTIPKFLITKNLLGQNDR